MIDPQDDRSRVLLSEYVQRPQQAFALLQFLCERLDEKGQDEFLVLIAEQAKAEAQRTLEAAATEAQAAGLDAVQIATAVVAHRLYVYSGAGWHYVALT